MVHRRPLISSLTLRTLLSLLKTSVGILLAILCMNPQCTNSIYDRLLMWFYWSNHIGPPSYVVAASDLHAKRPPNSMMKYADDSYLLVGSRQISTVNEEFSHIKAWAASNNLQLNPLKTRELIVY